MTRYFSLAGLCGILFFAGLAFGRWTLPAKVVTKTEVVTKEVEVIKYRDRIVKQKAKHIVEVVHHFPDGTLITKRTEDDKETSKEVKTGRREDDKVSESSTKVTTEYRKANWRIGALLSADVTRLGAGFDYGGRAERRVLGPVWLGVEASKSGHVGASVSVEF